MPKLIPLEAIDPDAQHREWRRQFEWHLDQIPILMETMRELVILVRASRTDAVKVSGGGYIDNVPIRDGGASVDSDRVWGMLVEYVRAVTAWLNNGVPVPWAPVLPPLVKYPRVWSGLARADADPLTARRLSFEAIAWLIEHADTIELIRELDEYREQLFREIRRTRGRYRSSGTRRRANPRMCGVCGECAVLIDWIDGENGSPKPLQVGRCKVCGQVYTEGSV